MPEQSLGAPLPSVRAKLFQDTDIQEPVDVTAADELDDYLTRVLESTVVVSTDPAASNTDESNGHQPPRSTENELFRLFATSSAVEVDLNPTWDAISVPQRIMEYEVPDEVEAQRQQQFQEIGVSGEQVLLGSKTAWTRWSNRILHIPLDTESSESPQVKRKRKRASQRRRRIVVLKKKGTYAPQVYEARGTPAKADFTAAPKNALQTSCNSRRPMARSETVPKRASIAPAPAILTRARTPVGKGPKRMKR
ncbi:hypothetical protein BC832DRAFT_339751 [Gaertneriomyces semiglobifer]|nr:hypothetical protein BC832DRAFT_339751 [Gaertneriomyces semiglobifer]